MQHCPECGGFSRHHPNCPEDFPLSEEAMKTKSDSKTPIDSTWLRSVGFLPDDSNKGDLFLKIWQPGEPATRTQGDGWTGENLHLFVCEDGSYGFESYDEHGDSVAILSVGIFKTRGEVRRLVRAINGRLRGEL